jgi:cbb3-type cytochrome oxidase subunit 3
MFNDRERCRPVAVAAGLAALVLVFAATWFVLDRTEHRPRWVVVEAPGTAVVGRAFEVRVTLDRSVEATKIVCTLNRANDERRGWGYLASSGPARTAAGGGTYSFLFTVPPKAETAYVFALVYLSPTGEWREGTRAVSTELIPVGPDSSVPEGRPLERVAIRHYPTARRAEAAKAAEELAGTRRAARRPSPWAHPVLAGLLLAGAYFALRSGRREPAGRPEAPGERTIWLLFAAVLAVSAAVEISGLAGDLASLGRRLAGQVRVYEYRRPFQKAVMAAVASASAGLFLLFIKATRRPGSHRGLWWAGIGLAEYVAVSSAGVLSFHAVDVFRSLSWQGVSPFDALRGVGAAVALVAAYLSARRKNGPGLT